MQNTTHTTLGRINRVSREFTKTTSRFREVIQLDLTFGASSVIIKETTRVVSATRLSCTVPSSLAVSMRTPAFFCLMRP